MSVVDAGGVRSAFPTFIPNWLANRRNQNVAFRVLWVCAFFCDLFIQTMLEGYRAPLPGVGTPTALGTIGVGRGLPRGDSETDDHYTARLIAWKTSAHNQGRQIGIATELHNYFPGQPKVSVINRNGKYVICEADGTIVTGSTTLWDWDSVDCPFRANYWSDEWVIVYPDPWAQSTRKFGDGGFTFGDSSLGMGHLVTRASYGDGRSILAHWKAAHSNIQAVIFTTDASLFDFTNAGTLPDGKWGKWGIIFGGDYVTSDRNLTTCRYWTPSIADGPNP